jgi:diguanylate cyclase (GGDEF)-like protein
MDKILTFSARYPRFSIVFLIAVSMLAATLLPRLQINISAQSMMVKTDPAWISYQHSLQTFGSDNVVIVYLHDRELFTTRKLTRIKQALSQIESLDFVKGTSSLFNAPNVKQVDDYILTRPYLDPIPPDETLLKQVLDDAKHNPLVLGNLISQDGNTMAINVYLDGAIYSPGLDSEITRAIDVALQPLSQQLDEVFQMGSAFVRDTISRQIQQDQKMILPVALGMLILVLGLTLRRMSCALLPLLTALMSIVLTLAVMVLLDIPVNVLTSIVPALLIIIGSTEDVHLLAEYHGAIERGMSRPQAVMQLPKNQSLAILLTFLTTLIGFLSITVNDLELLSQFGWVVSLGLIINFIVTALFIPAYLQLFGSTRVPERPPGRLFERFAQAIFRLVIRFKKTTLLLLMLAATGFGWGIQFLQINNSTLGYFDDQSPITQRAQKIHQNLSGMQTLSIVLESGIDDTFLKVRYLQDIQRLQQFIGQRGVFDKSFSFADFIMLTNQVMQEESTLSLPDEDELVQAYMGFVKPDVVKSYVSEDFSSARILIRHNLASSRELDHELAAIRHFIDNELKTQLNVIFTGESVLTNRAANSMAIGQIQSLILMVTVIFVLVSLLFIDVRAGLLAIVPNVFPVIILFGTMGYFNIALDTGTTMVAVIAIGICVDDTIHFLSRYHHFTRGTQDVDKALLQTVEHEATPIISTSLALALGFATLTLSSFTPVANFGALSALVMMLAMFSTFVLTPILLSFTRLITVWDMLSLNLKSALLKNSIFFGGLKNYQIKKVILSGEILNFKPDDIIVEQGQKGEEIYVVLEGYAAVQRKDRAGSIHTLGRLGPGELFGEVAQLTGFQRMARVTAEDYVRVLMINWQSISQLGRFHPRISMTLFRNLSGLISRRLTRAWSDERNMRDESTGAVTRSFLFEQISIEQERIKRYDEPLSLIMLDIDFRQYNESVQPALAEKNIQMITRLLSQQTRRVDIFARWDENRFIVLMPRTSDELALAITRRMKDIIEQNSRVAGRLHISTAVTQMEDSDEIEMLLARLQDKLDKLLRNTQGLNAAL